jgi:hypothetical protein
MWCRQQQQYYNDGRRDGSDNGYGHMRGGGYMQVTHHSSTSTS